MPRVVKVAFASCRPDLIAPFLDRFAAIAPEAELFVVSEFPPPSGRWVRFRPDGPSSENRLRLHAALEGAQVAWTALVLQPGAPFRAMRWLAFRTAPLRTLFYNTGLDHFTVRPRGLPIALRHVAWRVRERLTFQLRPGGDVYTWLWRLRHPRELRRPFAYAAALAAMHLPRSVGHASACSGLQPAGITVVIPSRNGRSLLERVLPRIETDADEIIVVDNGSDDGTAQWLRAEYSKVRIESSPDPLSFARAVNRGIFAATRSHVCLLNNDMVPEPGFLPALLRPFAEIPDLFCATAQIFFPPGKRREETGKAVMRPLPAHRTTTEFPVHCIEPFDGEDGSYVLYGSGGCSLYDTAKLRALGGIAEIYQPAYVEDLDAGVRAWQRGWPTVFVASARTLHEHRATTSRYYNEEDLRRVLERNYLLFIARNFTSKPLFRRFWRDAIDRLNLMAALEHDRAAADVLAEAWRLIPGMGHASACSGLQPAIPEHQILALGSGDVAVFPGRAPRKDHTVLVATCYIPWPLSHGGAVRIYNLMRRAADEYSCILVTFVDELGTPPPELLDVCTEIVEVRRLGSHLRPDTVEEFDSPAFHAALGQTVRKWKPAIAQLEFTQMAQYAPDCAPAKTVLVEHDITMDLYRQLLSLADEWDTRRQFERWTKFETHAWRNVDCVVTMSDKDRRSIAGARSVDTIPNGVDTDRFQPSPEEPEPTRLLFIGSFAHLPNLLALDFFLLHVWPLLAASRPVLHVIAGSKHEYHFGQFRSRVSFHLDHPGIELEGFVADVRPAYRRAAVVLAPLLASAGTNIKVLEAMAMGKAVVSTTAGINGLEQLQPGRDVTVANEPALMAEAITTLFTDPARRRELERNARETAVRAYSWDAIARTQSALYARLRS